MSYVNFRQELGKHRKKNENSDEPKYTRAKQTNERASKWLSELTAERTSEQAIKKPNHVNGHGPRAHSRNRNQCK